MATTTNAWATPDPAHVEEDPVKAKVRFIPRPHVKNTGPLLTCAWCKREFYFPQGDAEQKFFVAAIGGPVTRYFCRGAGVKSKDEQVDAWLDFVVEKGLSKKRLQAGLDFINDNGGLNSCFAKVVAKNMWDVPDVPMEGVEPVADKVE